MARSVQFKHNTHPSVAHNVAHSALNFKIIRLARVLFGTPGFKGMAVTHQ